ncbi:hypothetical protein [Paramagnetospirillum kuznetsovii]|uniref:hypothetical protein n=1 Tax=Paramagnetospirillum kuznetsovii TaxID=2053833 RepID=UPI001374BC8E|nr:hypothetical protein [Paramagnetospirillum kuznetsovii]
MPVQLLLGVTVLVRLPGMVGLLVPMIMGAPPGVAMRVAVLVQMLVGMGMGMGVAVGVIAMGVRMGVNMAVLMGMLMLVLVPLAFAVIVLMSAMHDHSPACHTARGQV